MQGRAWKFGDNVSTDDIIPGRFAHLRSNLPELKKHLFADLRPGFLSRVSEGDFIIAGKNFGIGSSREHAVLVIKLNGIKAILAKSVARIFYRNAFNLGLPILLGDTQTIQEEDILKIDLKSGIVENISQGKKLKFNPIPEIMLKLLSEGGLISLVKKYGDLKV